MPSETANTADLFEIIRTTRSMRRLKPDPVPNELIRKILEAGVCAPSGGKQAALAVPGNPRCEDQGDGRGLLQARLGRAGRPLVSGWRTGPWHEQGAISAAARCGGASGCAHPRGSCIDRPLPRRRHADPHVGFVHLSDSLEHASGGASAGPRRGVSTKIVGASLTGPRRPGALYSC
jgi:nitroreductase